MDQLNERETLKNINFKIHGRFSILLRVQISNFSNVYFQKTRVSNFASTCRNKNFWGWFAMYLRKLKNSEIEYPFSRLKESFSIATFCIFMLLSYGSKVIWYINQCSIFPTVYILNKLIRNNIETNHSNCLYNNSPIKFCKTQIKNNSYGVLFILMDFLL